MAEEKKDKEKDGEKKEEKKGGNKMMLIIIGIVVLGLAIGGGVFFALKGSGDKKDKKESVKNEDEESSDAEEEKDSEAESGEESKGEHGEKSEHGEKLGNAILPLDTFIVNLQVKGSFLKTTIQLEFNKPELPHKVESDTAKIRDAVIRVLSTKSAQEILTPEGKDQLREEIKISTNEALKSESVIAVYITEFIIQ